MQARQMRNWTNEELRKREEEAYRELFTLRRELALGRLEDQNRIEAVRRDMARIKTILRERQLGAASAQAGSGGEVAQ